MACHDGGYQNDIRIEYERLNELIDYETAFCALMSAITKNKVFDTSEINFKEAGITKRRFKELWSKHQEKDKRRKDLRRTALAKLSSLEKEMLGLHKHDDCEDDDEA